MRRRCTAATVRPNAQVGRRESTSHARFCEFDEGVVDEGVEDVHEHLALAAQHGHCRLTHVSERALDAAHAHGVDDIRSEAKGHHLWDREGEAFVEEAVEVDVNTLPVARVDENVLTVPIAETDNVADH